MTLAGTRPILQDELRQYELHHRARIAIKPGITGMWQVSGRSDITDLDCSFHIRKKLRKSNLPNTLSDEERKNIAKDIQTKSETKLKKREEKLQKALYYVQEVETQYTSKFIDRYFTTHDLHERLEIIRELSKYKSEKIIEFFYKVNACTRNFSLKEESMKYIQGIGLPFVLRRKKKGKKNYIDNEQVKNMSSPEILMKRLYVDDLEKIKKFDAFISHA